MYHSLTIYLLWIYGLSSFVQITSNIITGIQWSYDIIIKKYREKRQNRNKPFTVKIKSYKLLKYKNGSSHKRKLKLKKLHKVDWWRDCSHVVRNLYVLWVHNVAGEFQESSLNLFKLTSMNGGIRIPDNDTILQYRPDYRVV